VCERRCLSKSGWGIKAAVAANVRAICSDNVLVWLGELGEQVSFAGRRWEIQTRGVHSILTFFYPGNQSVRNEGANTELLLVVQPCGQWRCPCLVSVRFRHTPGHSWCNVCRAPVAERSHSAEIRREGQWRGVTDSELQDAVTIILTANITRLQFLNDLSLSRSWWLRIIT
jgi:hypothetical protein